MLDSEELPPALRHGEIRSIFPELFFVSGVMRMSPEFAAREFSRNMTIIREGRSLTLVNTLRLDETGLEALDGLGSVEHIVKLGGFHGRDDAFYAARYPEAKVWAADGMTHGRGVRTDEVLSADASPIADARAVVFESPGIVEALLVLQREGGIVLSCDALQNWEAPDEYFNASTSAAMRSFFGRVKFGPGWLNQGRATEADFETLQRLEFRHLVPAHGSPLLHSAREALLDRLGDRQPESGKN